jgi:hypothetical protein
MTSCDDDDVGNHFAGLSVVEMKAVVQRVVGGSVTVNGEVIAKIGKGLVVLVGIARLDVPFSLSFLLSFSSSLLSLNSFFLCCRNFTSQRGQK